MADFPTTQFIDGPDSRPWRGGLAAVRGRFLAPRWRRTTTPPPPPDEQRGTELSSLSPSLLQDLMRFDRAGSTHRELLEVLAACLRHTQPLSISAALGHQPLTLSIFPQQHQAHCQWSLAELLSHDLKLLQVLQVQPASQRPSGSGDAAGADALAHSMPLDALLWGVALLGGRSTLLPELAGQAAYRLVPGVNLRALEMPAALATASERLRGQSRNLREIASWPGLNAERAMRLLNALYLQSGLIVSRSHPAATNEGWSGYSA